MSVNQPMPESTRMRIRHRTTFSYRGQVHGSFNEARLTPVSDSHQQVLSTSIHVDPVTWSHTYVDYWGTTVTAFETLVPHDRLTVTSQVLVDVRSEPQVGETSWDVVRAADTADRFVEFLTGGPYTDPGPELAARVKDATTDCETPHQAVEAVCAVVTDGLEYRPGATSVRTVAAEAWATGAGVCQDFTHLTIGALRMLGIPARYVSGYLHARPDVGVGETVVGESHSWLEWWAGRWYGWDVTHSTPIGAMQVAVARGRDYRDVSPVRGLVSTPAPSTLDVSVELTREA